jgi:hypothetical protein
MRAGLTIGQKRQLPGIFPTFYWIFFLSNYRGFKLEIFLRNFSYEENFKLLRKDSDPSYLCVGTLMHHTKINWLKKIDKKALSMDVGRYF